MIVKDQVGRNKISQLRSYFVSNIIVDVNLGRVLTRQKTHRPIVGLKSNPQGLAMLDFNQTDTISWLFLPWQPYIRFRGVLNPFCPTHH